MNQFLKNDGGFKSELGLANSQSWLSSVNLQTSLHRKIPLAVYVDIGWSSVKPESMYYGAGIALPIVKDIVEIYFPCYLSSGLLYPKYEKNIRFVLNLSNLNPFQLFREIGS